MVGDRPVNMHYILFCDTEMYLIQLGAFILDIVLNFSFCFKTYLESNEGWQANL